MNPAIEVVVAAEVVVDHLAEAAAEEVVAMTEDMKGIVLDHVLIPQDQEDGALQLILQFDEHHFQGHDPIQDQIIKTNNHQISFAK